MTGSALEWTKVLGPLLLSWPLVTLISVLVLRAPLRRLITGLLPPGRDLYSIFESAKLPGGWEIKFRQQVDQLAGSLDVSRLGGATRTEEGREIRHAFRVQASESPALAVVEAWRLVENHLITLAKHNEVAVAPAVWAMPLVLAALLFERGVIDEQQYIVLKRLKRLRDSVIGTVGARPSIAEARVVIDLAFAFVETARVQGEAHALSSRAEENRSYESDRKRP